MNGKPQDTPEFAEVPDAPAERGTLPMEGQLATLAPMKYEYRAVETGIMPGTEKINETLNLYAQDNWRLVGVSTMGPTCTLFLERWVDEEKK